MPNGVAYADGTLKIGDILIKIDGETVANGKHKKGFYSQIIHLTLQLCSVHCTVTVLQSILQIGSLSIICPYKV